MKKLLITIIIAIISSSSVYPQEFTATVSINTENLTVQHRELLIPFSGMIQEYLNKNRWTEYDFGDQKIPVQLNIFFKSVSGVNKYSAQVAISAQREIYKSTKISPLIRMMDNNWEFVFDKNQILYFNPNVFDPLTSFFDFYANVILGLYFDTYKALDGNKYFRNALNIANLAASSAYSSGWVKGDNIYSRQEYMSEMMNEKYQDFRKNFFEYHYNGIDLNYKKQDAAHKKLKILINNIEEIRQLVFLRSLVLKIFFDTKYLEIGEIAQMASDKNLLEQLRKVDPSHISSYDEFIKKIK